MYARLIYARLVCARLVCARLVCACLVCACLICKGLGYGCLICLICDGLIYDGLIYDGLIYDGLGLGYRFGVFLATAGDLLAGGYRLNLARQLPVSRWAGCGTAFSPRCRPN
jgi:hypothetical protein